MVKYNGYAVRIGSESETVLEVYLDRHTTNTRSENYINALHREVDSYIKGLTERPECFYISCAISQMYESPSKRSFYFNPTGIKTADCTLISSDETYNDNFIRRIINLMERYWLRRDV